MSRQSASQSPAHPDLDLHTDADMAARGDEAALDRLFAQLGGSAWGVAFAAADAVGPATDAVARGFSETLQLFDNGLPVYDVRMELLRSTRSAALQQISHQIPASEGAHAREPLSLLGETKDRQATLALTALPEPMRSALWLSEAEGLSVTKTARLLGDSHKNTEDLIRQARANFRTYYVESVKRDGLSLTCQTTLDKLAAYVGRSLPAGDVAAVEHHLAECKECRSIVMKLDDLESRLHAAIPPLPAWTRQQVTDAWAKYMPAAGVDASREPAAEKERKAPIGAIVSLIAVAAAAAVVIFSSGVLSSGSNTTHLVASSVNSVATPTPGAPVATTPPATVPTAPPPTTAAPTPAAPTPAAPAASAPAPKPATASQTPTRRATSTTTPRTTPTTSPPSGYSLVSLPPTPIGSD